MAVTLNIPNVTTTDAKSAHVADSNVHPFLSDDFDPADYLNNALPPLHTSSSRPTSNTASSRPVPLNELSAQLQTLLTQLNAQTSRLSNALTTLTDEILRSGGRLAYEVEVLRGETITLTDSLNNGLKSDIEVFTGSSNLTHTDDKPKQEDITDRPQPENTTAEPEYLLRLRTLTHARTALTSTISLFGQAMAWPLAPSDLSTTSSLISVSAPDDDSRDREEKGKAYVAALHAEINELLNSAGDPVAGLEAAEKRVEEMGVLAEVWKGTAEEKARGRIVEGLGRVVEERRRALGQGQGGKKGASVGVPARGVDMRYGNLEGGRGGEAGYGFLQNLRNLKNDMYLE